MPERLGLVPSDTYPDGASALREMAAAAASVRAAVAFVTSSGAALLEEIAQESGPLDLTIVARGAPITQPAALMRLAEIGVSVSVVVGPRAEGFHPKLWLGSIEGGLRVLSGSGNLTSGGLSANDEQFEYFHVGADEPDLLAEHEARFQAFADLAEPLESVIETAFWREWEKQTELREQLGRQLRDLDTQLAKVGGASVAHEQLYADLVTLYERTKAEVRIAKKGGGTRPYVASRFKQAIDRGHREGTLIPVVARIVRYPTEGLEHLAEAERPDLMVETLVLDESKPYHHLFTEETKRNAKANLDAYWATHGG